MKRLNELIKCKYNIPIYGIKTNSKKIKKGDLFIAVHGYNCDHHAFISEAVANGASAIISEKKVDVDVPVIIVKDTNKALEEICFKFYNHIEKNSGL
ncbi:protein containing Mur ligase [human gut metagenome]|uniref:Protein containing Mur ligase n=1 Tax=human gut metagenome TaxID=408170 RepID=K1RU13_9ZZZZ